MFSAAQKLNNLLICAITIALVVCRGYNIGVRLIEDFLARSNIGRCNDFRETADVIAKVGQLCYIFAKSTASEILCNWTASENCCYSTCQMPFLLPT